MSTLPSYPCYLNGEFSTLAEAKISVLDRGFIFGDGVYEVAPVYHGKAFRFDHHMARLDRSLAELRIANPLTHVQWRELVQALVARFAQSAGSDPLTSDYLIYIQVTRGVAMRDHPMLPGLTPTVFVMCSPMKLPSAEQRQTGVVCVTADDFRWQKAHIKSVSLLGAVFSRQISVDAGALETVMFRGDYLSEAAASNVWVVKDGQVVGPPRDNLVLEGIRYGLLAELCQAQGIGFALRPVHRSEVLAADELLLTSATKEVLAITTLDGQPVGHANHCGAPGPVYAKLYAAYQQAKQDAA
ncbi:MAG: D-amino acid aminotransferase [Rhodoferax sp.]